MIVDYQSVTITRGDNTLFKDVTFQAKEGEFIYLTGHVGSGKSSLLKTLYREERVTHADRAEVLGFNMLKIGFSKTQKLRRQTGVVFQDFQLFDGHTVRQNLDFVLQVTGWNGRADRDRRIGEVLEMVKLKGYENRSVLSLSQGERQCVAIARAILNNPQLIIADEPTGNLDTESARRVISLLHEIRGRYNSTVIMATHNMSFVQEFPGRHFIVPGNGELLEQTQKEVAEPEPVAEQDPEPVAEQDSADEVLEEP